jgi:thiamine pyrophosphokinase
MRTLIIAHGDPPSKHLLESLMADSDLVIATDGAANGMIPSGIRPHVVFGDFDSLDPGLRTIHPEIQFIAAPSQEASDLDKAVAHSLERGADSVVITGAGGGRIDHTLANVSLLLKYRGIDIAIIDDRGVTRAIETGAEFVGQVGDTLSLIPFEPVSVAWTRGLKWPLRDEELRPGTRGVSNVFTESTAVVSVESGILIACHLRNPDSASLRDSGFENRE